MTTTHHDEKSGPGPDGSTGPVLGPGRDRGRHDELHNGAQEDRDPLILLLGARGGAVRGRVDEVIGSVQARVRDGEEEYGEESDGEKDAP